MVVTSASPRPSMNTAKERRSGVPVDRAPGFLKRLAPEYLVLSKCRATGTPAPTGRKRKTRRQKSEDFRFSRLPQKPWRRDAVYTQFALDRMMNSQMTHRGVRF